MEMEPLLNFCHCCDPNARGNVGGMCYDSQMHLVAEGTDSGPAGTGGREWEVGWGAGGSTAQTAAGPGGTPVQI